MNFSRCTLLDFCCLSHTQDVKVFFHEILFSFPFQITNVQNRDWPKARLCQHKCFPLHKVWGSGSSIAEKSWCWNSLSSDAGYARGSFVCTSCSVAKRTSSKITPCPPLLRRLQIAWFEAVRACFLSADPRTGSAHAQAGRQQPRWCVGSGKYPW